MEEIKENKEISSKIKSGLRNIVLLGMVSFFIDLSTEMVYPFVPIYLALFGVGPAIIGVIEGFAESFAALLKVYSGYIGDKYQNKKNLAFIGYSTAVLYKIILFFSFTWVGVFFARLTDRIGKGIRTAPRDTLVAESGGKKLGSSFGLHKMLDMLGSALGVILTIVLYDAIVKNGTFTNLETFKLIFLVSIIPAVIGVIFILLVKETKRERTEIKKFSLKGIKLNDRLKYYLIIVLIFSIGNSSNAFLLLKANEAGFSPIEVLLFYFFFNISASLFAFPMGFLSDKIGRSKLVVPGYLLYGLVYIGFALFTSKVSFILLFIIYGLYQAVITGAEKAFISENSPKQIKGTVLGLYGTLQGVGILFASLIAGGIWDTFGSKYTFYVGGAIGLFAAIASLVIMTYKPKQIKESAW